jgi:crossover junction endodeoxyribonuclease RuvC
VTAPLVIGVDPGVSGAISFLSPDGQLLAVEDMPVDTVQVGKHSRSRVSFHRLAALLSGAAGAQAFIELPQFRPMMKRDPRTGEVKPSSMGVMGAGAFGISYGLAAGALMAAGCSLTEVNPGAWMGAIGLSGGKDNSRRMAADRFPAQAGLFARKKDDGRADSCLLGWYGILRLRGEGIKA